MENPCLRFWWTHIHYIYFNIVQCRRNDWVTTPGVLSGIHLLFAITDNNTEKRSCVTVSYLYIDIVK